MAIGSTLAYPLDEEMSDASRLHLPGPPQTAGRGDLGGRIVEDGGVRGINPEKSTELRIWEAGRRRRGAIDAELGFAHLCTERPQIGQHGIEELAGIPRPRIAPAASEGLADGRRPFGWGNTALL